MRLSEMSEFERAMYYGKKALRELKGAQRKLSGIDPARLTDWQRQELRDEVEEIQELVDEVRRVVEGKETR